MSRRSNAVAPPLTGPSRLDSAVLIIDGRHYRLMPLSPADASESANRPPPSCALTPRERQVARLVALGQINKQIGDTLGISEFTVSTHLRRIFAKLGVDTRAAMVTRCFAALDDVPSS